MSNTKIMIVDDSPFQISLLSDTLTEAGFEVVATAQSLEEIEEQLQSVTPDLVTMDMTLPGTNGFECTKRIHAINRNIKVVVVSSMMDDELVEKAKKLNISGYVQKPVDGEELTLLINRIMANENLYLELKEIYANMFKEALLDVFNRLTKSVPEVLEEGNINEGTQSKGVSIVMGIIGKYSGRLILDMSFDTAQSFSKLLLKRDPKSDDEMLNIVAEVANMFSGNACSMLNKKNKLLGLRVAPPTTVHGESIMISKAELEDNYYLKVKSQFGDVSVNIGFKRGEREWMSIM